MITLIPGGGGNEIGASNLNLCFDDIIVACDCGGRPLNFSNEIRLVSDEPSKEEVMAVDIALAKNPWPKFEVVPYVNFLILLHGHLDHVLATPLLVKRNPKIKIYATKVTKMLALHQWEDTIRIAERRGEDPPFTYGDIAYVMSRFQEEIPATDTLTGEAVKLTDDLSFVPIHAGHILGAASCFFIWHGEVVGFVSSDISYASQNTVAGAPKIELDDELDGLGFMAVESTRPMEKNPPREVTEQAVIARIRKAASEGKSVRILTFAIGRTQEALFLAKAACPVGIPIWVDGSGVKITKIYAEENPELFQGVEQHYINPERPEMRWQIMRSPQPSIVIVPSGMQFGGCAQIYAREEISRSDRLFLSLGWLDPCSPEYAFFEQSQKYSVMKFGWQTIARFCETARFNLTAHCDGEDIKEMRERMRPDITVLVHGEDAKMNEFVAANANMGFVKGTNFTPLHLL